MKYAQILALGILERVENVHEISETVKMVCIMNVQKNKRERLGLHSGWSNLNCPEVFLFWSQIMEIKNPPLGFLGILVGQLKVQQGLFSSSLPVGKCLPVSCRLAGLKAEYFARDGEKMNEEILRTGNYFVWIPENEVNEKPFGGI